MTGGEDESLTDQSEGISNQNQGGLDPGEETTETTESTESATDESGETVPQQEYDEEEILYDDGLGLPDSVAGETAPEAQSLQDNESQTEAP